MDKEMKMQSEQCLKGRRLHVENCNLYPIEISMSGSQICSVLKDLYYVVQQERYLANQGFPETIIYCNAGKAAAIQSL